ncbi:hypothetical protein B7R22_02830 [Subtercola boreus]|uniref:cellulase n=1 Tax=Subtercola boreus TaxID=120213 RepID=A0A3E0W5N5_9MICO|nr:hypothetical protein B7R22_02830 [Subtercola boreus]
MVTGCSGSTFIMPTPTASAGDTAYLRGVNVFSLYASRFQSTDSDSIGEPQSSYDYLASRGIKLIRLAVPWERLQPIKGYKLGADETLTREQLLASLKAPIDKVYLAKVVDEVEKIQTAGMVAIVDLHAGCKYPSNQRSNANNPILRCGDGITTAQLSSVWKSLSTALKDERGVLGYDLVNEPNTSELPGGLPAYEALAQALITVIRDNGDSKIIWVQSPVNSSDAITATTKGPTVVDPLNALVFSQHFYPYGTALKDLAYTPEFDASTLKRIDGFGMWCNTWKVRCSIGEIGWPGEDSAPTGGELAGWNSLGDRMYQLADYYQMDVTYFEAMSSYHEHLVAYDSVHNDDTDKRLFPLPGINQAHSQAEVIERHPTTGDIDQQRLGRPNLSPIK